MDIEFHYYMTYLIVARAGVPSEQARIIAHSAQAVDDNHIPVRLMDVNNQPYENKLSQTMDIFRPHMDDRIYPVFHFIPGDPKAATAQRIDKREHPMNTTPNSALANRMLDAALDSGDLYRIGVSAHGFVDTWAHQNFVGARHDFNEFPQAPWKRMFEHALSVGHAPAEHRPDWPALVWEDERLQAGTVDNRARFLDAADALFRKFVARNRPQLANADLDAEVASLRADLSADIGPQDNENAGKGARIARYKARALTPTYGGAQLPEYDEDAWFNEAIVESRQEVRAAFAPDSTMAAIEAAVKDWVADESRQDVTWRDPRPDAFSQLHWYKFQRGVEQHLDECWPMVQTKIEQDA